MQFYVVDIPIKSNMAFHLHTICFSWAFFKQDYMRDVTSSLLYVCGKYKKNTSEMLQIVSKVRLLPCLHFIYTSSLYEA